ncbi:MAG TPA: A/G-specific adenine glycosylase [Bacteroidetes bacterium]|nr:A/G-specific adenine glycosylase [Bacteroidota bacterium]
MKSRKQKESFFTKNLLLWHKSSHRPLPWKGEKKPYLIWLSEIILQQTRVGQGLPYFEKFKKKYPAVTDLANAPEDEVMKLWEGLGYYSRARNLHAAAKYISNELNGIFPDQYKEIIKLKGVGPYTAAAIASFAFGLPYAVVDGNVYRVLSRYFGIEEPIDTTSGKNKFAALAQALLDTEKPGTYNQAIMDFGATHCLPAMPKCGDCLLKNKCTAFQKNTISILPIKSKKIIKRQRFFNYLLIDFENKIYIKKRTQKDIWQNLYDFPLIETDKIIDGQPALKENIFFKKWLAGTGAKIRGVSAPMKQDLTHQRIIARFWKIEIQNPGFPINNNWKAVPHKNLKNFAFPKVIDLYFRKKLLPLKLF